MMSEFEDRDKFGRELFLITCDVAVRLPRFLSNSSLAALCGARNAIAH